MGTGELGRRGEQIAAAFLRTLGYRIIETNWRPMRGRGELDIIASYRGALVLVEVKTRAVGSRTFPAEVNITPVKANQLGLLAGRYCVAHPAWRDAPVQIDVVAVTLDPLNRFSVRHWPRAIGGR